jgi:pSer/pThr/pTyr-binding forkhead associated (FHA) protein
VVPAEDFRVAIKRVAGVISLAGTGREWPGLIMGSTCHQTLRLIAVDGSREIVVGRSPMVIGRHPGCDVRLGSSQVSRRHCCLSAVEGDVVIHDLGSTNGVWINGQRVTWGRLRTGDRLSIARFAFRLEAASGEEVQRSGPSQPDR